MHLESLDLSGGRTGIRRPSLVDGEPLPTAIDLPAGRCRRTRRPVRLQLARGRGRAAALGLGDQRVTCCCGASRASPGGRRCGRSRRWTSTSRKRSFRISTVATSSSRGLRGPGRRGPAPASLCRCWRRGTALASPPRATRRFTTCSTRSSASRSSGESVPRPEEGAIARVTVRRPTSFAHEQQSGMRSTATRSSSPARRGCSRATECGSRSTRCSSTKRVRSRWPTRWRWRSSARNLVLLGDPQQLAHVSQGVHPAGSGVSVLEHLLGDARDRRRARTACSSSAPGGCIPTCAGSSPDFVRRPADVGARPSASAHRRRQG